MPTKPAANVEESYQSSSHGAGRKLSRNKAKKTLDVDDFRRQMQGRVWQESSAQKLIDEAPDSYKDVDRHVLS